MTTSPNALHEKVCVCTGVRGCAACEDPALRRAFGLHPRPQVSGWAARRVAEPDPRVQAFDLRLQAAPGRADFQGVHVWPDFYSEAEAAGLLARLQAVPFEPAQSGKAKQHFGARVNFKRRKLATAPPTPLPDYRRAIEVRLAERLQEASAPVVSAFSDFRASDLFVLRYEPTRGSNLDFHIDDTFAYADPILGLSLESDSVLSFIPEPSDPAARPEVLVRVPLPARSAVALCGPARHAWQHGILADDIVARRTSVTLRTLGDGLAATPEGAALRDGLLRGPL